MTHKEIKSLKTGDVLEMPSGLLRIVRDVSHSNGKTSAEFFIQRCSWTGRGYTVYFETDLKKWKKTKAKVKCDSKLDTMLLRDRKNSRQKTLTCCMVKGLP